MTYNQPFIGFFEDSLPKLKEVNDYWSTKKIEGFTHPKEESYEANVELKKHLHQKWVNATSAPEKLDCAKEIISDWGGVRGNKPDTLKNYVDEIEKDQPDTPLKGVASYSKLFSIANLEKYAIYDARVAVSLNAIQYLADVKDRIAFNYISGRNNITGHVGKKKGFAHAAPFKKKTLIGERGWKSIERDETYSIYLNLLNTCLESFPDCHLYDLEMALFYNAENLCEKAAEKAGIIL